MRRIQLWSAATFTVLTFCHAVAAAQSLGEPAEGAQPEGAPTVAASVDAEMATLPAPGQVPAPSRVLGVGTAFGGGGAVAGAFAFGARAFAVAPALELPTLEGYFFIDDHLSIDVVVPILNAAIVSAVAGPAVAAQVYADFSVGDGWVRFVVGPGIGFSYIDFAGLSATQLSLAALLGLELLTPGRSFGFRVMSRPFVAIAFVENSSGIAVGGGALLELGFIWYVTNG